MRQKMVWRYWCDHCGKGGCGKGAMLKHEQHCIRNPDRDCRMCAAGDGCRPTPIPELISALVEGGIESLRAAARGCPACMLAGVVQERGEARPDPDEGWRFQFDYKAECAAFWKVVNENAERPGYEGDY